MSIENSFDKNAWNSSGLSVTSPLCAIQDLAFPAVPALLPPLAQRMTRRFLACSALVEPGIDRFRPAGFWRTFYLFHFLLFIVNLLIIAGSFGFKVVIFMLVWCHFSPFISWPFFSLGRVASAFFRISQNGRYFHQIHHLSPNSYPAAPTKEEATPLENGLASSAQNYYWSCSSNYSGN